MNDFPSSSSPFPSAKLATGLQQSSPALASNSTHLMQMAGANGNAANKPSSHSDPNLPFYLITPPVEAAHITGATHLLTSYDLLSAYNKFSSKKVKQNLSSFISHLPGPVDTPATEDNSGLLSLVQRHPPVFKEIKPLTGAQLTGFRLYPGPIPDQYKIPLLQETQSSKVKKHKKKKSKKRHQSGEPSINVGGPSVTLSSNVSSSSVDLKNTASGSSLSSIATSRHSTNQSSISTLTSTENAVTSETFASSASEISSLSSDKKNRKRVYEERDEKKKKKDKKKKRKKEIPSD